MAVPLRRVWVQLSMEARALSMEVGGLPVTSAHWTKHRPFDPLCISWVRSDWIGVRWLVVMNPVLVGRTPISDLIHWIHTY